MRSILNHFICSIITCILFLITGYGTIAPSTFYGQMFFIPFAIIGIPMALVFLARIGSINDKFISYVLRPVKRRWGSSISHFTSVIILILISTIVFILIPAIIYDNIEEWNFWESMYFTVVTLTTVGFGDYVPAQAVGGITDPVTVIYKLLNTLWLWLGLAVVASLISEGQRVWEKMGMWFRRKVRTGLNRMKVHVEKEELRNMNSVETNSTAACDEPDNDNYVT